MRMFRNMKLYYKIFTLIVVALVMLVAVSVISYNYLKLLSTDLEIVYQDSLLPIESLGDMRTNTRAAAASIIELMITDDTEMKKKLLANIKDIINQNAKLVAELENAHLDPKQDAWLDTLKEKFDAYGTERDKVIELAMDNRKEDAYTLFHTKAQVLLDEVNEPLVELTDYTIQNADAIHNSSSKHAEDAFTILIISVIFAIVLLTLIGLAIANMITKPIRKFVDIAGRVADGDLNVTIDVNSKDEIGVLASAFRQMVDNLNEVMGNIQAASEQVAAGSRQVSESSMALSQGATEQASSVEQLTVSLEEISSQTNLNAASATQANTLAEEAKENAALGNGRMKEMLKAMDDINDASGNISKIIKVIDEIAFQTNILALNAAVEAARAGQHGKGFAVVAEEVRNLAARSAGAAKETTDLIEGSIKKVEGGTRIAGETAAALSKIVDGVAKVANLVSGIAVASNEQATGVAQINQGIMQVSQVVQTNSATSEESAAASEELSSQAVMMQEQVVRFKLRKAARSSSQLGLEELSPDVIRMLESMSEKNRVAVGAKTNFSEAAMAGPRNIALSDREFGKY